MNSSIYVILCTVLTLSEFYKGVEARYPMSDESQIRHFLFNQANFSAKERPVLHSSDPVDVTIRMSFYAMLDLNERDQVITTASWITMQWRDERLSWDPTKFGGENFVVIGVDEIWTPKIFISNALDSDSLSIISPERGSIILTTDGFVALGTPVVLATECPMNIHFFPYDTQVCTFEFYPQNQPAEKLVVSTVMSENMSSLESAEWELLRITNHNALFPVADIVPHIRYSNFSAGWFCLFLERHPEYYIKTLVIPSSLLCLMSFVTFIAPPDSGERISLGVSMVLGLTVFQLLVSDILPTTGEKTPILSNYLTCTFVLACLAVPLSLMNINIAYGDTRLLVLKYNLSRKLILEYLPRLTGIPSYTERISSLQEDNVSSAKKNSLTEGDFDDEEQISKTTSKPEEGRISKADQIKIEARTVALMMDRFAIIIFFIVYCILCIKTYVDFTHKPVFSLDHCGETS